MNTKLNSVQKCHFFGQVQRFRSNIHLDTEKTTPTQDRGGVTVGSPVRAFRRGAAPVGLGTSRGTSAPMFGSVGPFRHRALALAGGLLGLILQDLAFEQHIEGSRSGLILAQTCQVNCGVFVGNDCAADCLHFLVYCCLRMIDVGNYVRYGLSLTCHMCILCSIVPFCWVCLSYCSFDNIGSYWLFESL